jgi:hypothetical protein
VSEYILIGEAYFIHTGTFFCVTTTAHSLPRTPTEVMLAAVIALNAYSVM